MNAWKYVLIATCTLAVLIGLAALALLPGAVPPVMDEAGRPVQSSLAVWEPVTIGGVRQWLAIRGRDPGNPVLLFVHGGPGDPETTLLLHFNRELSDFFTLVCWEQQGAGRSFSPDIPAESMTLERFIQDTKEVTRYLQGRFRQQKIYLAGHSWGSVVGILAASRNPEDYRAYIGISQAADQAESERIGYDWVLAQARERGHRKAVEELERLGPPVNGMYIGGLSALRRQRRWDQAFGGATYGPSIWPLAEALLTSRVYSLADKTAFSVAERYLDTLRAPAKRLIPFERSAHTVPFDEPEKLRRILEEVVLQEICTGRQTGN